MALWVRLTLAISPRAAGLLATRMGRKRLQAPQLQRPLPDGSLQIGVRGVKRGLRAILTV